MTFIQEDEEIQALATHDFWQSGFVERWHTHPDRRLRHCHDTTAGHSQRVAILVLRLLKYSKAKLDDSFILGQVVEAIYHDSHEVQVGDMPADGKNAWPALREAEHAAGIKWRADRDCYLGKPSPLVKLCDMLDAYLLATAHAPDLLGNRDWREMRQEIIERAEMEGFEVAVQDIMRMAQTRELY